MAEGTIKRLTDKGFGFIDTGTNQDMFFHSSNVEGVAYDDLHEGQKVTYVEGHGPKGPRAEQVTPA
ncbi:MAG: cold-shock protein [Mariniblastus sp.]